MSNQRIRLERMIVAGFGAGIVVFNAALSSTGMPLIIHLALSLLVGFIIGLSFGAFMEIGPSWSALCDLICGAVLAATAISIGSPVSIWLWLLAIPAIIWLIARVFLSTGLPEREE